jgi:hypothetical protein
VPYVAGWAGGDAELVRASATRVLTAARGIVHDLGLDPAAVAPPARPGVAVDLAAGRALTAPGPPRGDLPVSDPPPVATAGPALVDAVRRPGFSTAVPRRSDPTEGAFAP